MRRAPSIRLTSRDRAVLNRLSLRADDDPRTALRARIVLESANGRPNSDIARLLGVHSETVTRWRRRYSMDGLLGLNRGAPRVGSPTDPRPEMVERILSTALDATPGGRARWSTRSLARVMGTNHMLVHRVWTAYGVAPYAPVSEVSLRRQPPRVDVEGLYLHPPAAAIVFRVDPEPPSPNPAARASPAIGPVAERLGAALSRVEGELTPSELSERARLELLVFLRGVEERAPPRSQHNVLFDRPLESLARGVTTWLDRHPRYRAYSTPPGERWSSVVARWVRRWEQVAVVPDSFQQVSVLAHWIDESRRKSASAGPAPAWIPQGKAYSK